MLALGYRASPEAEAGWPRLLFLLRLYRRYGPEGFASRTWRQELGVRIQGIAGDPMRVLDSMISAAAAVDKLRGCDVRAYNLVEASIEGRPLRTERGTGVAQTMGLTREEEKDLLQWGIQCIWQQTEMGTCEGCLFGGRTPRSN